MATKSTVANPGNPSTAASFENELPTYRALSALALTSAGAGLLSGLSFVSPGWLFLAVIAVITGFMADRRIKKMPDVLTGRSFAQAGLALGLIFGLSSVGYTQWSYSSLKSSARGYAEKFVKTLNETNQTRPISTSDVLWLMLPPEMTRNTTPEEAKQKLNDMVKNSAKAQGVEETIKQMLNYAGQGQPFEVLEVENVLNSDGETYASILVKVGDGTPKPKNPPKVAESAPAEAKEDHDGHDHEDGHSHDAKADPAKAERISEIIGEGPDHALVYLHGTDSNRQFKWFVDQIKYPYVPKSFVPVAPKKVVDDGHGHGH